nr:EthD domain-containing protein [uncultured Brevundimonas sp.]
MLKMSLAIRRRAGLTHREFLDYWHDVHAPLVVRLAADIRLLRYVQLHGEDGEFARQYVAYRGVDGLHDGVAQLWWKSEADRLAASATSEGVEAARLLREDEQRFCDLARSTVCFGRERPIYGSAL